MKKGIAYGVGVGPGDPELMTVKAIRLIRENDVIAVPGEKAEDSLAYKIAVQNVPKLSEKKLLALSMPMVKDRKKMELEHRNGAKLLEQYLDQGKNVVYLTLGDPTIYCSFSYLQHILEADGYPVELVSGVPSFCACAARLNQPLTEWDEPLHIIPALYRTQDELDGKGSFVLMKSGRHMAEIKEKLIGSGREIYAVADCGMENEKIYRGLEEIPDETGYFSVLIAKPSGRLPEE